MNNVIAVQYANERMASGCKRQSLRNLRASGPAGFDCLATPMNIIFIGKRWMIWTECSGNDNRKFFTGESARERNLFKHISVQLIILSPAMLKLLPVIACMHYARINVG